ncbi:hypothetical protein AB0G74_22340 [Streptomyces sp. NPDC020875]|uniref:hypothetical protein n=1 Tax=Streptomyces sp. NPDC020875 TaxID=3154898 RepID=UPI0033E3557C
MPDDPDFRLDGYKAASRQIEEDFRFFAASAFTTFADHHTAGSRHSYYVLHDESAAEGFHGEPQIVALYIQRDPGAKTFHFQSMAVPLPAMAQSWLIARGCAKTGIGLRADTGMSSPADDTTRALEERLVDDGDHFALLASHTDDTSDSPEITVLLRAVNADPMPFRLLHRRVDTITLTHTLREGRFPTYEAAEAWWTTHWRGSAPGLPAAPANANRLTQRPPAPAPAARPRAGRPPPRRTR